MRRDQLQLPPTTVARDQSPPPTPARTALDLRAHRRARAAGRRRPHGGRRRAAGRGRVRRRRISFAPGALEGILSGPGDPEEVRAASSASTTRSLRSPRRPARDTRRRIRELFREGRRARQDRRAARPAERRLRRRTPSVSTPSCASIFLRSGHRDEVKYSMALLSGFRRPEDAELFRVVGRHEEFTLYAAVALASVTDDPIAEWLALLAARQGLGAHGARGADPPQPAVRGGARAARARRPRRRQRAGARGRLPARSAPRSPGGGRRAAAGSPGDRRRARRRMGLAVRPGRLRVRGLDGREPPATPPGAAGRSDAARGTVLDLQRYLTADDHRYEPETGADRFPACGLDEQRLARVLALCAEYLAT